MLFVVEVIGGLHIYLFVKDDVPEVLVLVDNLFLSSLRFLLIFE